jgi:hypothetical protein
LSVRTFNPIVAFQHLLASRPISVRCGVKNFEQNNYNLREMGRL